MHFRAVLSHSKSIQERFGSNSTIKLFPNATLTLCLKKNITYECVCENHSHIPYHELAAPQKSPKALQNSRCIIISFAANKMAAQARGATWE